MKYRTVFCFMIIFAISIFLFRCSSLAVNEGGGATETVNARVITPSGIPDSGVSVYLIDAGNWVEKRRLDLPVVIDSAITNRDGFFTLKYDSGTVCNLQADGRDGAAFIPGFKADYDSILVIRLKQKATLNGRIDSSGLRISRAEIFGTLYSISVQGQDFTVPGIAPGDYPILFRTQDNIYAGYSFASIDEGQTEQISFSFSAETVLVDDFESASEFYGLSRMGKMTGGDWYSYCDTVKSSQIHSALTAVVEDGSGFSGGKCLRADAVLGNSEEIAAFAGVGVNIGTAGRSYDFSNVKSFSFFARGNCSIRFSAESRVIDDLGGGQLHFGKEIQLTDTWTEYVIPVSELLVPVWSEVINQGIAWDDAKKSILRLEFDFPVSLNVSGDTLTLQLDNLYINGVGIGNILP